MGAFTRRAATPWHKRLIPYHTGVNGGIGVTRYARNAKRKEAPRG